MVIEIAEISLLLYLIKLLIDKEHKVTSERKIAKNKVNSI